MATASSEDVPEVTSSDQTDINTDEESKQCSTFGFDEKTKKTDLTLIFGNKRLYVKRSFLEDSSTVLERLFEETLVEKTQQEFSFDDISCGDFAEFLACIQRKGRRKITSDNVYRMLEIASKYEIEDLRDRCEDFLLDLLGHVGQDSISILRHLKLATENDFTSLKKTCLDKTNENTLAVLLEQEKTIALQTSVKNELQEKFLPGLLSKSCILDYLKTSFFNDYLTKLEDFKNAKGFKIVGKVSHMTGYEESMKLWGIDWKITLGEKREDRCYPWKIVLEKDPIVKQDFAMKIGIAIRIKNHIPKKGDCSSRKIFTFKSQSLIRWYFSSISGFDELEMKDENVGFLWNEWYTIEAYFLMSKPDYLIDTDESDSV